MMKAIGHRDLPGTGWPTAWPGWPFAALVPLLLVRAAAARAARRGHVLSATKPIAIPAQPGASPAADGWTCGTLVETAMDGRNALLAVGPNGSHCRSRTASRSAKLVPGRYGYVSATRWVADLEITTFAATFPAQRAP